MTSARSRLNALRKAAAQKHGAAAFDSALHPRYPKGDSRGGQFAPKSLEYEPISIRTEFIENVLGRKTTTLLELSAIGADSTGQLTDDEIDRLNVVRNDKNSFEEFLASPPPIHSYLSNESFLFAGSRVKMMVSGMGSVSFSVDDSYENYEDYGTTLEGKTPSQELLGMQQIFKEYLNSRAGLRRNPKNKRRRNMH